MPVLHGWTCLYYPWNHCTRSGVHCWFLLPRRRCKQQRYCWPSGGRRGNLPRRVLLPVSDWHSLPLPCWHLQPVHRWQRLDGLSLVSPRLVLPDQRPESPIWRLRRWLLLPWWRDCTHPHGWRVPCWLLLPRRSSPAVALHCRKLQQHNWCCELLSLPSRALLHCR